MRRCGHDVRTMSPRAKTLSPALSQGTGRGRLVSDCPAPLPLAHLIHHLSQLRMNILPLAHADERKKVFLAELAELAVAQLVFLALQEVPQSHEGEEIAARVSILLVRHVGGLL